MLSARNRLRRRQDILSVVKSGQCLSARYLNIYCLKRVDTDGPRLAFVVGKKVHKSAVARHRIQRWLREIARGTIQHMSDSYDLVLVAKPSVAGLLDKKELEKEANSQLKKIFS